MSQTDTMSLELLERQEQGTEPISNTKLQPIEDQSFEEKALFPLLGEALIPILQRVVDSATAVPDEPPVNDNVGEQLLFSLTTNKLIRPKDDNPTRHGTIPVHVNIEGGYTIDHIYVQPIKVPDPNTATPVRRRSYVPDPATSFVRIGIGRYAA